MPILWWETSRLTMCVRQNMWRGLAGLAFCGGLSLIFTSPVAAGVMKLTRPAEGSAVIEDVGAPGGKGLAIKIEEKPGNLVFGLQWTPAPGLYRVGLPLRLHLKPGFNSRRLKMKAAFGTVEKDGGKQGEKSWLTFPISPSQLDATPGVWTVLSHSVTIDAVSGKELTLSYSFAEDKVAKNQGKRAKSVFVVKKPKLNDLDTLDESPAQKEGMDVVNRIGADAPVPVESLDYAAILVGDVSLEPITTTLAVEKVWPEYVHVYPGGSNPVVVTVRNFTAQETEAVVTLEMKTGLAESAPVGEQRVRVPASGVVRVPFAWKAGTRDYGYAAMAIVSVAGKPVHSNAEYFSVSTPIWKTAIQGNGFLDWYGRESTIPEHVDGIRRSYCNVEEAFSWQPSSWTDLNPTQNDWWAGQCDFHNSRKGLQDWVALSHSNGIKMITYSWATASGKRGFDIGRRFPDTLCRETGGIAPQIDLNDLDVYDIGHDRPELWEYHSGNWLSNFMNLGLLRTIHMHAEEVIKSAKTFGWDGIRFDYPPSWSPMGTADVQREFEMLGVKDVIKELMPEDFASTNAVWSGEAISRRNVRYFRYLFKKELGENFALSYNVGSLVQVHTNKPLMVWFGEMSRNQGQLMNEAIRGVGSIPHYADVALWHAEAVRTLGGYSCVFQAERSPDGLASVYSAVFTFASGAHPYLDYGWLGAKPGFYSQFMTRYGEYCWDLALAPVAAEKVGLSVESKLPLLWEPYLRQRQTGDGLLQTVVHLISAPEADPAKAALKSQGQWSRAVLVRKTCKSEPDVWFLTAEPELTAIRLRPEKSDKGYAVTVPSVHFWSMLVWSEKP